MDAAFETYAKWIPAMQQHFERRYPRGAADSETVHRAAIRAKALDTLRGMLPAATQSNVGIYGTGQAFESLLLRMRANPLEEVRACADAMLDELRKLIPAFLTRVDQPDRGGRWSRVPGGGTRGHGGRSRHARRRGAAGARRGDADRFRSGRRGQDRRGGAVRGRDLPDDQLLAIARRMTADERVAVLRAYVGERTNRRHRPGRAFERTMYRFDVLTDYGAFRDLQRHRLLTLEWQALTPRHGYTEPEAIVEAGAHDDWERVMDGSADLHEAIVARRAEPRRPLRRRDGVPRAVLHGDERARSDARHRAPDRAAGTSGVPACLPADAHADRERRRPRGGRGRDAVRRSLRSGAGAAELGARAGGEAPYSAVTSSLLQ